MRLFLKSLGLFSLFAGAVVIAVELVSSSVIRSQADFRLEKAPTSIVLGHSHPECAFNDSLIDGFKNLAQSVETYFYTFPKADQVLKQNKSIATVFIEFSNNHIDVAIDDWIWGESYISTVYPRFSSFMKSRNKGVLISKNTSGFLNAFSVSWKHRFEQIVNGNYDYAGKVGGYLYLVRNKTDSLLKFPEENLEKGEFFKDNQRISKCNLRELKQLIAMVAKHQRKVVLIRSPLHKKYNGFKNEYTYKQILARDFGHLDFLDFSDFPLTNAEFGDLGHLNHKGARYFSIWFNKILAQGFLEMKNKQEFINSEIARIRQQRIENGEIPE